MRLIVRGILWFGIYITIILFPLVAGAVFFDPQPGIGPLLYLAVSCGYIALALMATELLLVSRFQGVAAAFGLDVLLQFHREAGIASMAFAIAHPVLLVADRTYTYSMISPSLDTPLPVLMGPIALTFAVLVVGLSVFRRMLRINYELWQFTHGLFSIALMGFAAAHVLTVGRFAALPIMRVLWILYLAAFVSIFVRYRIVRPIALTRKPWEVVENRVELGQSNTIVLKPVGHSGFTFSPGQFGWVGFGKSPLTSPLHPISFSSNGDDPQAEGTVSFTIKHLGDWSRDVVPSVQPGARAWIDGPHGVFSIDREEGAGYVFIGGGVGITPLFSMVQALHTRGDVRPVYLFYGANETSDLTFGEELLAISEQMPNFTYVPVILRPDQDWEGETGFISAEILAKHLPPLLFRRMQYFICGPTPLMDAMERILPEVGVPADRIHTERFDMV